MKLASALSFMLAVTIATVAGQGDVRALFQSGKYAEVVQAVGGAADPDPAAIYLAALSHQKLGNGEEAKALFGRLAERGAGDPWHLVGQSGRELAEGNTQAALASATSAVQAAEGLGHAHYQLGLVYGQVGDFSKAAAAFAKATQADAGFASAHYHAGIAFYKAKRVDMMATHFESFLKLAPDAPEREEVESIMRTVRGR